MMPPLSAQRAGDTLVAAAFNSAQSTVVVARLDEHGKVLRTTDAIAKAEPLAGTELRILNTQSTTTLIWGGHIEGRPGPFLAQVDAEGKRSLGPVEIGVSSCATATRIYWVDRQDASSVRFRSLGPGQSSPEDMGPAESPPPALLCSETTAYAISDGNDGLIVHPLGDKPFVAVRDDDFDEPERRHYEVVSGPKLLLLRVAESGAMQLREITAAAPGRWLKLTGKLNEQDDILVTEATPEKLFIVGARDEDDRCEGGLSGKSHWALEVDRSTGKSLRREVSPLDCQGDKGPFWIAGTSSPTLFWGDPSIPGRHPNLAFVGFSHRSLHTPDAQRTHVAVKASALAPAGCGASGCTVVALLPPAPGDAAVTSPWRVLRTP